MNLTDFLNKLGACRDSIKWSAGYKTLQEAWDECPRGDWLLWLAYWMAGQPGWPTHQEVVLAAYDCAETALVYVPKGEDRPRVAVETARRWAVGKATKEDCLVAADAARAARDASYYATVVAADARADAYYAAAAAAAYVARAAAAVYDRSAADASYAAYAAAAYDAAASASAAARVANDDDDAAYAAAKSRTLKKLADIVRLRLQPGVMEGE